MGDLLTRPKITKESEDFDGVYARAGASSMQGWRTFQEDAHNCIIDFDKSKNVSFFAVYDGHNGQDVAEYCSRYLPDFIKQTRPYAVGDYESALRDGFMDFDAKLTTPEVKMQLIEIAKSTRKPAEKKYLYSEEDWSARQKELHSHSSILERKNDTIDNELTHLNTQVEPGVNSGCTAVVALLAGTDLYVANAGDSRAVVCRGDQAVEMSHDHKPTDVLERQRIQAAGGKVTSDGRVDDGLNLSRAIGDHSYKQSTHLPAEKQKITALPDIRHLTIQPGVDQFMILACDGIWASGHLSPGGLMTSQKAVDFVRKRLSNGPLQRLSQICEELFDETIAKDSDQAMDGDGHDNMSCVIVQFKTPQASRDQGPEE